MRNKIQKNLTVILQKHLLSLEPLAIGDLKEIENVENICVRYSLPVKFIVEFRIKWDLLPTYLIEDTRTTK